MRIILSLCALIIIAAAVWIIWSFKAPSSFGEFSGAPRAAVADILSRPTEYLGRQVTIEGVVEDQCPTTGCFFYFRAANGRLKVELGDLAQRLPAKMGRRATVEGQLIPMGDSFQFLGKAVEFH